MREYIVIVKEGEDLSALDAEMASSSGSGCVPNRVVECVDPQEHDTRMTHWNLTDEEATALKNDERVYDVEIPFKDDPYSDLEKSATTNGVFYKGTVGTSGINWGLFRCSSATDPYGAATLSKTGNYHYALDGTGVDIVIMDDGVQNDHPEFQDAAGNSRVKEIDWYAASGGNMSGTMPTNFYTQQDNHGTFCAGISAGKTYGWAKNADIYVMKNFDTDALPTETGLDLIRHWHNNKGTGRPTVVNMSFGFIYSAFGGAQSGDTGNHWNTVTNQFDSWTYGDSGYENATNIKFKVDIRSSGNLSKKVSSVDAKIDQMIAAGIHIVVAGGNGDDCQFEYTANTNNNYYDYVVRSGFNGGANVYYHQSSSPMTTNNGSDIRVGNINNSNYDSGREILVSSSARGPAIDIHAPGTEIVSTTAGQGASYNQVNYPSNSSYKIGRSTGTSFSAPQVTGLSALYLQLHPTYTPAQLKTAILGDAKLDLIHDELSTFNGASSKYLTLYGLWGSPNRYMFNKFHGDMVAKWS